MPASEEDEWPPGGFGRIRAGIAWGLIWAGRALLVVGLLWVVGALALVRGLGELSAVTALLTTVLVATAPLLVLPVTSRGLVTRDGGVLEAPTVLGRRTLVEDDLEIRAPMLLPGSPDVAVLSLRDVHGRWLVVLSSESWDELWDAGSLDAETTSPSARPRGRHVWRIVLGFLVGLGLTVLGVLAGALVFGVLEPGLV